jgi:hypothetical protein
LGALGLGIEFELLAFGFDVFEFGLGCFETGGFGFDALFRGGDLRRDTRRLGLQLRDAAIAVLDDQ